MQWLEPWTGPLGFSPLGFSPLGFSPALSLALTRAAYVPPPAWEVPANSANLPRPFHREVYDKNLGKSLQRLWAAARDEYIDASYPHRGSNP